MPGDNLDYKYSQHLDIEQKRQDNIDMEIMRRAAQAQQKQQAPAKNEDMGFWKGAYEGAKGGIRNTMNAIDDAGNWLNENILDLRTDSQKKEYQTFKETGIRGYEQEGIDLSPDAPRPTNFMGSLGYDTAEFLVGFIPALRGLRVLRGGVAATTAAGRIAEGAVAAQAGTMMSVDPHAEKLADMINNHLPEAFKNPVVDYLSSDPNDSELEARFKTGLNNAAFGAVTDTALWGLGKAMPAFKGWLDAHGINFGEMYQGVKDKFKVEETIKQELDRVVKTADEAAAKGLPQAEVEVSQELKGWLEKNGAASDLEGIRAAKVALENPEVPHVRTPENEGVLPKLGEQENNFKWNIDDPMVQSIVQKLHKGDLVSPEDLKGIDLNLNRIDTPEQLKQLLDTVSEIIKGAVQKTTRGEVTHKATQELADWIGATPQQIKAMYDSTGLLAERVTAGRMFLVKSGNMLLDLAQKVRELNIKPDATEEEKMIAMLAMRKQTIIHAELQAQLKGSQTEIARALSAMRIKTQDARFAKGEIKTMLDHFGGSDTGTALADAIMGLYDNPAALNQLIRKSPWARSADMVRELYTNGILSGLQSSGANVIGNTIRAVMGSTEKFVGAGFNKILRRPKTAEEALEFGEATAHFHGLVEGFLDAFRLYRSSGQSLLKGNLKEAGETFGKVGDFGGTQLDVTTKAITAEGFNVNKDTWLGKAINYLGGAFRLPGEFLQVQDGFFKHVNARAELRSQAFRMARSENLEGNELAERISQLLKDPTTEMLDKAHESAVDAVFARSLEKENGIFDSVGIWFNGAKNTDAKGKALVPALHYFVPFVKTPVNIFKYSIDHLPGLALVNAETRKAISAGGRSADMAYARMASGGMILGLASYFATMGEDVKIVGAMPQLTSDQKNVAGIQPYSVKIGDTYYAYNRVDPLGMLLGIAADTVNLMQHPDQFSVMQYITAASSVFSQNLASKSYLTSVWGLITALDDAHQGKPKAMEAYLAKVGRGFIPFSSLLAQSNKAMFDQTAHELTGFADMLFGSMPGYSQTLPPRRNLLTGNPIVYEGGMGPDIASPLYEMTDKHDPVADEIVNLRWDGFKHPPKRYNGVDLTSEQYDRLMVIMTQELGGAGNLMRDRMEKEIKSPAYQSSSSGGVNSVTGVFDPGSKQFRLNAIFGAYKNGAYQQLMREDPELFSKVIGGKKERANNLLGIPIQDAVANQ